MSDQIIRDARGRPLFAIVPWDRYRALAGDDVAEDLAEASWAEAVAAAFDPRAETFPDEVADRLIAGDHPVKVFREHRGLTQGQLSERAGIGALYLSQIETGRRRGSHSVLRRLAAALGITVDDLDLHDSDLEAPAP